ncbi:MAG: hypothetical protein ACI9FB_003969 [Candidatus Azotimanducaceae bacterium]|jgi:hypothetical protein
MNTGLEQSDLDALKSIGINVIILVGVTLSLITVAIVIG